MEEPLRLRVVFDDRHVLTKPQRSEGLKRCWILLKPEVSTIADLADHLVRCFSLQSSCPHGVILSMDSYVLPSFESSCIFKDKDIIRVKKGGCVKEIIEKDDDGLGIQDSGNVAKQPIYLSDKLLAIQEFEEETEKNKSNEEDYACTIDGNRTRMENPIGEKAKSKRKRNHSNILQGSKTKKAKVTNVLKQDFTAGDAEECNLERNKSCSPKKATIRSSESNDKPLKQNDKPHPVVSYLASDIVDDTPSFPREKRTKKAKIIGAVKPGFIAQDGENHNLERNPSCSPNGVTNCRSSHSKDKSIKKDERCLLISYQADDTVNDTPSSAPRERSYDRVETNCSRDTCEPHANAVKEKGPSRSARRKKAKRLVRKEMIKCQMNEVPSVDTHKKSADNQVTGQVPLDDAQKKSTEDQLTQKSEAGDEVVPVIVRPGHIRFEPLDEEHSMQQSKRPVETLQWNGTTNKKMGQKWGREKTLWKRTDDNVCNWEPNQKLIAGEVNLADDNKNFESLRPLSGLPKVGDVIAYRMVELSESWCPELSSFRVGEVLSYDSISMKIVLVPVPEYPIIPTEREADEVQSLYKEDGSLEIDYSSLVDARLLKGNTSEEITPNSLQRYTDKVAPTSNREGPVADTTMAEKVVSPTVTKVSNWELALANNGVEGNAATPINTSASNWGTPLANFSVKDKVVTPEKGPDLGWEQISRALDEKKSELSVKDGWGNWTPNKNTTTPPWSYRALRRSAVGPTVTFLRSKNRRHG